MGVVLEVNNLKAYYTIEYYDQRYVVRAVDDVSLRINECEILGICGESGCGKSTLLKALYGLTLPPLKIFDGKIFYYIDGKKIDLLSLDERSLRNMRWRVMSYIPQGSMSVLNPTMRIRDQFIRIIRAHNKEMSKNEIMELIERSIEEKGLPHEVLSSYPHQLSGGMRQRVVIALATVLNPKIVFADEPTTALDVIVQRGILQMLKDTQRKLQNVIILVTHDMGVQAQITDRVAVMYAGHVVEVAPTESIYKSPLHPYTWYLINSLPRIGDKKRRKSIGGAPPSLINPPLGCRFAPRCPMKKDKCVKSVPKLVEVKPDHYVACHLRGEA
mgnify:CR=1 FL=1